jgi:hypothetical protein
LEGNKAESGFLELDQGKVAEYLRDVFGESTSLLSVRRLGAGVLGFVYVLEIVCEGEKRKIVLKMANPSGFGQDFPADRADTLIYANSVYDKLPFHVKSFDVGAITPDGRLKKLGDAQEFFLLMEHVEGEEYAKDLDRIAETGRIEDLDVEKTLLLAEYMAQIHKVKHDSPGLYVRRIRDLVGRGDCITGIIDSYPRDERTYGFTSDDELEEIEKLCIKWRWKLRGKDSRLCQVHGDLHPFNILWQGPYEFVLLDRSRGEWGEAADDVSCLSINYIFWSLKTWNSYREPFKTLFENLLDHYLELTNDVELMKVIAPFYAFRSLVIANPLFYPNLSNENRRRLFNFMRNVLEAEAFEPSKVESYLMKG